MKSQDFHFAALGQSRRSTLPFSSNPATRYGAWCTMLMLALTLCSAKVQAQNYTISTAGNVLTITDLSGNGDVLAVTEDGSGIRFDVTNAARTYSLNGGAATSFPVTVPNLATFTSIVVNAAGGTDEVSITGFTTSLPSLTGITVNGGAGDLTFTGLLTLSGAASYNLALNSGANLTLSQSTSGGSPVHCTATATGNVTIGAPGWNTNGGFFTSSGANFSMISGPISTSGGDVTLNHAGYNVTVQNIGIQTGGGAFMAQGADMTVESSGLNTSRSGNPGGDVTLTGTGNVVVKNGGIQTGGGKCEIIATGNVQVTDAGVSTCGDVTDGNFTSQGVDYTSGGNGVQTCGGNVTLTHTGNVTAIAVTEGGTFSSTGKTFNCIFNGINTSKIGGMGGSVTLNHAGYSITFQNGGVQTGGGTFMAQGADITVGDGGLNTSRTGNPGGNATLTATGNILLKIAGAKTGGGTFMAQGVDITITDGGLNTSRSSNLGGDVTLTGTGNVAINFSGIQTGGGKCEIVATGNVQVIDGGVSTCGDVTDGHFTSQGVDYTSGGIGVQTCGGNVTLTHTGNVTAIASTQGGTFSSTGKNFNCINGGINTSKTGGMGGSVTLNHAGYNITFQNGGVQTGGGTFMAQGADITISDGGLNTSRSGFVGGNATLTHTGNVLVQNGGVQTGGGTFNSQGVDITIKDGGLNTARSGFSGGNVTLTHTGIVSVQGNGVQTGGGTFNSTGTHATVQDGGINATGMGSSTVTMNHSGDVSLLIGNGIQANGNISLTANSLAIGAQVNTSGGTVIFNTPNGTSPIFSSTDVTGTALSFTAGSNLNIVVNGTTPGDGTGSTYTQLAVVGSVNLTGVDLVLSGSHVPVIGQVFTIVDNDGMDAITGTFTGLPQNGLIANFLGSSLFALISYTGGTGNDVTITVILAPDYTITTAGNVLTITDNKNNGDVLEITEDGAGMIKFNVTNAARTYDLNGVTSSNLPYTHALAGITSIVVNTKGGADAINVGAFANTTLPNLTLNGGTGNDAVNFNGDITFALNANLNVDLQNDDAPVGVDNVTVAANANLFLLGTGTATVKVSKNVLVNTGGSIETANGNLTVEANQQVLPTSGDFQGVELRGGTLKVSGTGLLNVKGKGGNATFEVFNPSSSQNGVLLEGGQILGGTGGTSVTVQGTGGASSNQGNVGVLINSNAIVTSSGGDVSVTGQGGGKDASGFNIGVYVGYDSQITAGASGQVTVQGTGGASSGDVNSGVWVETNALVTSSGGNVNVTGQGGGSGTSVQNEGILVQNAGQITAGGSGTVTVTGNGGTSSTGGADRGVTVLGSDSKITSSGGNVSVTGTGGGSGMSNGNWGIFVVGAGQITAGSSGTVTVVGNGGTAPTGSSNYGVLVNGTDSKITSSSGNVSVTGVEGSGPSGIGFVSASNGQVTTATNGGNVTLIANSMSIGAGVPTPAGNSVTLRPYTNGVQIDLGSATDPIGGPLSLSDAELDWVTTGTLNIGDANTGDITVSTNIDRPASTVINLTTGDEVNFDASALNSAGGNVNIDAVNGTNPSTTGTDVNTGASSTLDFAAGDKLNIAINGTSVDAQYSQLNIEGKVDITGVELVFSGSYTPAECQTYTIVNNDGTDAIVGTFNGLAEGAVFTNFRGSGFNATITYIGGDGNDVVIDVPDVTPPTITCPSNIVRTADANQCSAAVAYTVSASDNCSSVTLTRTNGQPSGSAFPVGFSVVNWLATDVKGNSSACSFSITVTDNQLPSIVCPSNVTKVADPGQCTAVTTYPHPNFSDNCPGAYLTRTNGLASGSQFPAGMTNVAWQATDAGGNTAICNFTVTVSDTQMPSITCPANVVKNTDAGLCAAVVSYPNPTVSDNCSSGVSAVLTSAANTASGSAFMKGATQVIWQATDGVGLTKTCAFTVTVNDAQAPTITCPGNQVRNTDTGLCTAVMNYTTPTFTDNCAGGGVAIQSGLISGSAFPKGQTTVVWRATDAAGLTKTCSFRVTVNDAEAPTFTICPASQSVNTGSGVCTAVVNYATPTATDNCMPPAPSVVRQSGLASGSNFPKGVSVVVWRATDGAGLTKTCSFTVTVTDAQLPTITCPANIAVTGSGPSCSATVAYANPTATDNCGIASNILLSGLASGANFSQGVTTNVWRATDNSGLTRTCAFTVTVSCGTGSEQVAVSREELAGSNGRLAGSSEHQLLVMNLAPNPATTEVQVMVEGLCENGGMLTVFDAQGRMVWQKSNILSLTSNINVADLPAGLYFVTLRSTGTAVTKRLVVSR